MKDLISDVSLILDLDSEEINRRFILAPGSMFVSFLFFPLSVSDNGCCRIGRKLFLFGARIFHWFIQCFIL